MGNFKVKVNTPEESKEVQDLFEVIGYEKGACSLGNYPAIIVTTQDWETGDYCSTRALGLDIPAHDKYKEITLPELRDMVVLKRNDVNDAQYVDTHGFKIYINSENEVYYFEHRQFNNGQYHNWVESGINGHRPESLKDEYIYELKPIEKTMKEYIDKQEDGTYKLITASGGCVDRDWIEVPEGAIRARFYPHDPDELEFENAFYQWWHGENKDWAYYADYAGSVEYSRVVWQRTPSLNDQYAEIEQVRQTLNERQSQYGEFANVAETTAMLMDHFIPDRLSYVQREALHMICSKLARIANGDPNHVDSWHDIAGYATLVVDDLES